MSQEFFTLMDFQDNVRTKSNQADQVQYLIMNYQPQETWIISEPTKQDIVN
jgi:hypothetical protein